MADLRVAGVHQLRRGGQVGLTIRRPDDGSGARRGQLVSDAPDAAFWALGFRNQIVAVIPSEGIVAVRMGAAPPPGAPFTQAELTMGVLDAVVEP